MRDRAALGAEHVGVFSVAQAEMAFALSPVMLADRVRTAAREKAMDVVLLGGSLPGVPVDTALVASVRSAVGDMPVLANSGVRSTTVAAMLAAFDGCLVGSDLKRDAILHNPVDPGRAAAFLAGIR
jgi:predicted TIM-barrel enzyme